MVLVTVLSNTMLQHSGSDNHNLRRGWGGPVNNGHFVAFTHYLLPFDFQRIFYNCAQNSRACLYQV